MFKKILVPLDGSAIAAAALSHVMAVTQKHQASITLLRVMESSPSDASVVNPTDWQLQRTEANTYLDELVAHCASSCEAEVEKVVQEGPAADRILEQAQERKHDLIVISSHGRSGLSEWNVSSVAHKVINRAGVSILLVRAYRSPEAPEVGPIHPFRYRRILVPLDGSLRSEHVLPVATRLAQEHDAKLMLIHGVATPEMFQQTPLSAEHSALVDRVIEHNKQQAEQYFEELSQRLDVASETIVVVSDDVLAALHRVVEEKDIDLVILSAHGRSGEHAWRYGGLTSGFITYGTSHLLIIQDAPWRGYEESKAEQAVRLGKADSMRKVETYATPLENGHSTIYNPFATRRGDRRIY